MTNYRTENPATGEVERSFEEIDRDGAIAAVDRAHTAHEQWARVPAAERSAILSRTAELYEERADELARAIAVEMGKPLEESKGEVALSASIFRWYADHAPDLLREEQLDAQGALRNVVSKEPVGVLLDDQADRVLLEAHRQVEPPHAVEGRDLRRAGRRRLAGGSNAPRAVPGIDNGRR